MNSVLCTLVLIFSQQIIGSFSANPHIFITGTNDGFTINHAGEERLIIDNDEATKWDLYPDTKCKSAVEQYFGKSPNDCFLHEPTPWKLYPTYGWQEVTSIYKPTITRFVQKTAVPVPLINKTLTNNEELPVTVQISLKQSVIDKITHKKIYGNDFGNRGFAKFSILVINAGILMNYNHTLGADETIETVVELGKTITVNLQPHSSYDLTLTSYNVTAIFEATYSNSLEGYVAANYNPAYKDHHFWALSTSALEPTKKPKQISESLTFEFFTHGFLSVTKTDLKDKSAAPVAVPLSDLLYPREKYAD